MQFVSKEDYAETKLKKGASDGNSPPCKERLSFLSSRGQTDMCVLIRVSGIIMLRISTVFISYLIARQE